MTKRSDAFCNAVSSVSPNFLAKGSFLYRKNPALMLRGFAFDAPPGGCYIWKYYLPLFKPVDFLHMSLGYRVNHGYIDTSGKSVQEVAGAAYRIIASNDDFSEEESLDDLLHFAKDSRVSPNEREELFEALASFETEPLERMFNTADANRRKLGV